MNTWRCRSVICMWLNCPGILILHVKKWTRVYGGGVVQAFKMPTIRTGKTSGMSWLGIWVVTDLAWWGRPIPVSAQARNTDFASSAQLVGSVESTSACIPRPPKRQIICPDGRSKSKKDIHTGDECRFVFGVDGPYITPSNLRKNCCIWEFYQAMRLQFG